MLNAFRRPNDRYGSSGPTESPYQRASQEWDNRIGSAAAQARNLRFAAFAAMGLAALSLGGFIYQSSHTNIATYVVPIDKYGRPGRIELADQNYSPTTAVIGYFLADWVKLTRSKSIDPIVIRDNWTAAYRFIAGPGIGQLNDYAKSHDPFANAGAQAVNVEIVSVQHEFGIYGGPAGSHLLAFLRDVQMPVSAHLFGRSHGQSIARCAHDTSSRSLSRQCD